jgi:transposase
MTTYILHKTLPCQAAIKKSLASAGAERRVMLGLDLELKTPAGALSIGGGTPLYLGKHPREVWTKLVDWLVQQGCKVHVVQEACGFGWEFHRQLEGVGACSRVVAPEEMSGKRKTDKRDASALAALLWDYEVRGNKLALRPVRVPTVQEQQRRGYHRNRGQWLAMRHRIEAQGRSLMWDHGWLEVPKGWWRPSVWEELCAQLCAAQQQWLLSMLCAMQQQCLNMQAIINERKAQALAQMAVANKSSPPKPQPAQPARPLLPKGLGDLSYATLNTEVVDWSRFKNRGQAGSFIGCCPREHSSGPRQKLGEIDRMGNSRLRTLLVEAVWRLRKHNAQWRGFKKFAEALGPQAKASGARKRKAVVACARLLMIDLWRLHVGTATLEGLGLQPAEM